VIASNDSLVDLLVIAAVIGFSAGYGACALLTRWQKRQLRQDIDVMQNIQDC
jgi:hypothetical protein